MLTDQSDVVIGVDTHAERHALALLEAGTARTLAFAEVAACREGYREALRIARRRAQAGRVWALEGSGSYGAGLARFLAARGERVLEVERPPAQGPRGRQKADALDAERAARAVLSGLAGSVPRRGEAREALRQLLVTREGAVAVRRAGLNELRALLLTAPEPLRERLRRLSRGALLARCAALRPDRRGGLERFASALALRSCARRVRAASAEAAALEREIERLVGRLAPALLAQPEIGPVSAAALLLAWSHPGRLRSEAAFARLAGAAPIPASSGKVVRVRLDRGGDRRLNRALHTIVLSRRKHHPPTIAYIERRRSEGKSLREAIRCLKRYLARSLFRLLEGLPEPA